MSYYRIKSSIEDPYDIVENPQIPENVSFLAGRMIGDILPLPLAFDVNHPQGTTPGHLLGNVIPIVSTQLLAALTAAGVDNFQTFPAVLRQTSTGRVLDRYAAFNVVGLVSAVDRAASTWDVIMPGEDGTVPALVDFKELVLVESNIRGLGMFRLVDNPLDIMISDRVLSILVQLRPEEGWGITVYEVPVR